MNANPVHAVDGLESWPSAQVLKLALFCLPALLTMHLLLPGVGGSGLQTVSNNLALISFSLFAVQSLRLGANQARELYIPPNFTLMLLGVALILLSSATGRSSSFYVPAGALFWFFIFLATVQHHSPGAKHRLLWVVVISGMTETCLGTLQVFGWTPEIDGSALSTNGIPVGGIQQANLFASYLCASLAAWGWLLLEIDAPTLNNKRAWTAVAFASLMIAMIILSGSRTGWVSLGVVGMLGGMALGAAKKNHGLKKWVVSLASGTLLSFLLADLAGSERISEKAHFESARWQVYTQSITLAAENPLLGVGYGNVEASYVYSAANAFAAGESKLSALSNFTHVHNGPLQWYLEGGVLGLLGICLLAVAALMMSRQRSKPLVLAYFAFLAPIGLHFLTEFPLRQSMAHAWLLIVGTYCIAPAGRRISIPTHLAAPARAFVFSLFGIAIPLLAVNNLNSIYWTREINKAPFENAVYAPNIVLPGPLKVQVEYALAQGLFAAGRQGDRKALETFIGWAEQETHRLPRSGLIKVLMQAKVIAGDMEGADAERKKLEFYFSETVEKPFQTNSIPARAVEPASGGRATSITSTKP